MKMSFPTLFAATGFLALACANEPNTTVIDPSTTNGKIGAPLTNASAINQITNARCTREERCNNVGSGKKFADRTSCEKEINQNTSSDLRASECPGVVQKELDECLNEVRNQACNNPIDAISRVAACTRAELCK